MVFKGKWVASETTESSVVFQKGIGISDRNLKKENSSIMIILLIMRPNYLTRFIIISHFTF